MDRPQDVVSVVSRVLFRGRVQPSNRAKSDQGKTSHNNEIRFEDHVSDQRGVPVHEPRYGHVHERVN